MARPLQPPIQKNQVIDAALAIIDEVGLSKFNVRRLASELGISAPTLYHHFKDKDDVLAAVVRHVLAANTVPASLPKDPIEAIVESSNTCYRAIAAHPEIVPLLRGDYPRHAFGSWFEYLATLVGNLGVPESEILAVIDALEALVVGLAAGALQSRPGGGNDRNGSSAGPKRSARAGHEFPYLHEATRADALNGMERLDKAVRSLLIGWSPATAQRRRTSK